MNVTSRGSIGPCLEALGSGVSAPLLQEHRVLDRDKLAGLQAKVRDFGFEGIWSAAAPVESLAAGASAGATALARTSVSVTAQPFLTEAAFIPGRLVAARTHFGVKGGLVVNSTFGRLGWLRRSE